MRTHFAYCANVIPINPYMSPATTLSKYKRDLVVSLCQYISHQPKTTTRNLNTLVSAANHFVFDSQLGAAGSLDQNDDDDDDVLPPFNEKTSPRCHEENKPPSNHTPENDNEPHSEATNSNHSLDQKSFPSAPVHSDSTTNCSSESYFRSYRPSDPFSPQRCPTISENLSPEGHRVVGPAGDMGEII